MALAILAGALAVLGEVMRLAGRNSADARALSAAQLLAASKFAEITSGLTALAPAQRIPFDTDPNWWFSVVVEPVDEPDLIAVRVTVGQDIAPPHKPVEYSLVRWIPDPDVEPIESSDDEEEDDSS